MEKINDRETRVLMALKYHSKNIICKLRNYEIARITNLRTIQYILNRLEEKKYIRRSTKTVCPMMGQPGKPCSDRKIRILKQHIPQLELWEEV